MRFVGVFIQAYCFALEPSSAQERMLRSHCGAQRFAFNWGLARVRAVIAQREAERSYGVAEEELTPTVPASAYALRREWNRVKQDVAPWWAENSKEAYASGLANLSVALGNWSDSRTGSRKGRPVGFPRFKGKRARSSCRFTTGSFGLARGDRRHVRLPRIGLVRTFESTRKLARHIERGSARIRSATVSYRDRRWFASFSVEVERPDRVPVAGESAVGVDLGVRSLAVLSTGEVIANPRCSDLMARDLVRLQRKASRQNGPDRRTRAVPSGRWSRTWNRITSVHARVAAMRRDNLHKLTTRLTASYGVIVIEDLNVLGMLTNRRLARAIADCGFGELRRQLEYKAGWSGGRVELASRWFPSSKQCCACGVVKAKLHLSERVFACEACGLVIDRDANAARNLAALHPKVLGELRRDTKLLDGNPGKTHSGGHRVLPREDPSSSERVNAGEATHLLGA